MNANRSYNCKDEELSVVCGFSAINLTRDLNSFTGYSPIFNQSYVDGYKAKIEAVQELVQPKSETVEVKLINERIYFTLDGLISPIDFLEGYLGLAGKKIPVSSTDFGLLPLRRSAHSRDVESVLKYLHTVDGNITKYKDELVAKGLNEELVVKFSEAKALLSEDKNKRYKLVSNRTAIVQNNLGC